MRLERDTSVSKRCHGVRELQEREGVVTLTDAKRNGVADKPRLLVLLLLPGGVRQDALLFAEQIDAGELPEAPRLHKVMDPFGSEVMRELVVIDVA